MASTVQMLLVESNSGEFCGLLDYRLRNVREEGRNPPVKRDSRQSQCYLGAAAVSSDCEDALQPKIFHGEYCHSTESFALLRVCGRSVF